VELEKSRVLLKYAETSLSQEASTSSSGHRQSPDSQEPASKKMKLFSFMESHSQNCQPEHAEFALTMRQELMDYFRTTSLEYDSDTLAWYKSHTSDFSHVARAVRTVLSIPASSAPVERIFSTTGKIFRPERSRLKTEKFEQLVFIKCNKRLHWQSCMNIEQWQWPLRHNRAISSFQTINVPMPAGSNAIHCVRILINNTYKNNCNCMW